MKWRILLVIPLVMLLAGCATGRRVQNVESKMDVLNAKVDSVEERQNVIDSQTGASRESVGYLKGKVEGLEKAPAAVVVTSGGVQGSEFKGPLSKKDIQAALKKAGFYDGPVDGKIGRKTKKAIKEFQQSNGLKADGVVGEKTKSLLAKYLTQ